MRRRRLAGLLALLVALAAPAAASGSAWPVRATEKLFPESPPPAAPAPSVVLAAGQDDYEGGIVALRSDAPVQVNVHFAESGDLPTGVGEPGVPPVVAALANAIYAATGRRLREMPFSKQKLV